MFKRRDIPPVLLLLLLIILVMLTLSQILVVHNGRYGRNVHNMRKLQLELREMDINLHSLMMQNVPSIELNRRLLQNEINAGRIAAIIAQASKTQSKIPTRQRDSTYGTGSSSSSNGRRQWQEVVSVGNSINMDVLEHRLASSNAAHTNSIHSQQQEHQYTIIAAETQHLLQYHGEQKQQQQLEQQQHQPQQQGQQQQQVLTFQTQNQFHRKEQHDFQKQQAEQQKIRQNSNYSDLGAVATAAGVKNTRTDDTSMPSKVSDNEPSLEDYSQLPRRAFPQSQTTDKDKPLLTTSNDNNNTSSRISLSSLLLPPSVAMVQRSTSRTVNTQQSNFHKPILLEPSTSSSLSSSSASSASSTSWLATVSSRKDNKTSSTSTLISSSPLKVRDYQSMDQPYRTTHLEAGGGGTGHKTARISQQKPLQPHNPLLSLQQQQGAVVGSNYGVGMVSRTSLSSSNNESGKLLLPYVGRYGVLHVPTGSKRHKEKINYCPSIPPNLKGRVFVNFEHRHNFTEAEIVRHNAYIRPGGMWRPTTCVARHRVAIIVPYRDRWEHLMILLSHLHPILERQQLDYRIFVVEQWGKDTFNKARIMNIAFVEALKQNNFQCFVFHDVDLVPEDDRNMYSCPIQPRHMSVAIDEMGYKLAYQELVGGVLNMRTEHFQRVNGYSNLYWGWGAEDDDMAYRIMHVGLKITRPPEGVARYKMVKHTKRKPADWRKRAKLLYTGTRRFQFDGLNSLQYRVVHIKKLPLFSHILVDIGKPPRGF